jgi:hypothetical protein
MFRDIMNEIWKKNADEMGKPNGNPVRKNK